MKHVLSSPDLKTMKALASQRSLTPQPDASSIRPADRYRFSNRARVLNGNTGSNKSYEIINCRFRSSGCDVRLPRDRMELHLRNNAATHSLLLLGRIDQQEREKRKLCARVMALEKSIFAITEFLGTLDQENEVPGERESNGECKRERIKKKLSLKDIIRNLHIELARAKVTPDIKPVDSVFQGPRVSLAALSRKSGAIGGKNQNSGTASAPATPVLTRSPADPLALKVPHSQLPRNATSQNAALSSSGTTETEAKSSSTCVQSAGSDSDDVQVEIQIHNPAAEESVQKSNLEPPEPQPKKWGNEDNHADNPNKRENCVDEHDFKETEHCNDEIFNGTEEEHEEKSRDGEGMYDVEEVEEENEERYSDGEEDEKEEEFREDENARRTKTSPEDQDLTAETLAQMSELCADLSAKSSPVESSPASCVSKSSTGMHMSPRIRNRAVKRQRSEISHVEATSHSMLNTNVGSSTDTKAAKLLRSKRNSNGMTSVGILRGNGKYNGRKVGFGIDTASLRAQTQQAAKRVQQLMDEDGKLMSRKRKTRHRALKQKFGLNAFEAPKKPKTAYNYYQIGVRESILKELLRESNGHLGSKEVQSQKIARVIGERWKNMPDHERQIFNNLAAKDKERYKRDLDDYVKLSKQLEQSRKQVNTANTAKAANLPGSFLPKTNAQPCTPMKGKKRL